MKRLKSIIKLIRIYQWTKSGFIFLPFIFSDHLVRFLKNPTSADSFGYMGNLFIAFLGFSFLASAGYVLNDWRDRDLDRMDPKKKDRPLASGALSSIEGLFLFGILLFTAIFMGFVHLPGNIKYLFLIYFSFNTIFYSFVGKQIVLLDVFTISIGFVLRVLVGAAAINVPPSPWLLSCTFFIALFLGFSKRYHESLRGPDEEYLGGSYEPEVLKSLIDICASLAIVSFSIYSILGRHKEAHLYFTVPLVVMGVFRYYILMFGKDEDRKGNPSDVLMADRFLLGIIVTWVGFCAYLIYAVETIR